MCHDMIEIEKMGKPAVPIVSGRFEKDAVASSRTFAMPDLKFVTVPRIYRNLALDECVKQTELAIDSLVHALVSGGQEAENGGAVHDPERRYSYDADDRYAAVLRMNEDFLSRDWGDSLPLYPATR